ncbi:MAG: hypothetical protein KAG26_08735, partial [Methylococcales bacterium]|nr:hypothetical protein [Methylococcales bacterium]
MRTFKEQIVEVAKGVISPADLRIGGDLTSQAASSVISLIEKTDFFSKITTERMTKLSKDIEVLDILPDQLVRVAQGAEATDDQKVDISEYGCVMTSLPIQLFADIKMDTLRDNADNPQLLNIINGMFTTRFQNDLNKLGFQGTADTGATFLTLCKGWWQIATD